MISSLLSRVSAAVLLVAGGALLFAPDVAAARSGQPLKEQDDG